MGNIYRLTDAELLGFDPSWMSSAEIQEADNICKPASDPDGSGPNPYISWQGVLTAINERIQAEYVVTGSGGEQLDSGGMNTLLLPIPSGNKLFTLQDIRQIRNTLRSINAGIVLPPITKLLTLERIQDLLTQRWTYLGPINTSYCAYVAPVYTDGWQYVFDMKDGRGPQPFYLPSELYPPDANDLLARYAQEDVLPGESPKVVATVVHDASGDLLQKYSDTTTWVSGTYQSFDGQGDSETVACQYAQTQYLVIDTYVVTEVQYATDYEIIGAIPDVQQSWTWVTSAQAGMGGYIVSTGDLATRTIWVPTSKGAPSPQAAKAQLTTMVGAGYVGAEYTEGGYQNNYRDAGGIYTPGSNWYLSQYPYNPPQPALGPDAPSRPTGGPVIYGPELAWPGGPNYYVQGVVGGHDVPYMYVTNKSLSELTTGLLDIQKFLQENFDGYLGGPFPGGFFQFANGSFQIIDY